MKISRMNRGTWGKVRAFFDVQTSVNKFDYFKIVTAFF